MNVAASKKGVLWEAPLLNDKPDTKGHIYREKKHGLNPEIPKANGYTSDSGVYGENPSSSEMSVLGNAELGHKHEEKINRDNQPISNSDNVVKGETRENLPNKNESYDSNRTRHFVIDRNNNLVLKPGEDDGAISNFEQENLAKLTEQATYGIGNLEKLAHDNQGMQGFQPPSVNSYEKANRPGLIAWTGPENPGLPDEETVKVNDYTGQSTVDSLERMVDNGLIQLQAFENSKGMEKMGNLEKKPELVHGGVQSTEQLNAVLDSPLGKMPGNKISNSENSQGPIQKETAQDVTVSRLQFGKHSQNSKLEEKARNDKESISDDLKMLPDAPGGLHKAVIGDKVVSTKPRHNEDKSTFIQNALMWHNKLRCVHGSDRLRLNETLAKEADDYANHIVSKLNGILEHSKLETRHGEGENLAMTCSSDRSTLKGAEATFKWYNDICEKGYDFKSNIVQHGTGHFTQLVWKDTTEFGIGRATTKKNGRFCTVIVARYYPRGNIQKKFADNVNQGDYNDQTCEKLESDLISDSKFVGCAKGSGSGVHSVHQNRLSNTYISNGKILSLASHPSTAKQKQKEALNQEIDRVTSLISKIEAEELAGNEVTGGNNHLNMPVDSQRIKGSPYGGHGGFVGLGGTGSPLVIYHGATGFFENPKAFANIGVETHNKLREIHGSPKLKLDMGLTVAAFQYATYLTQLGFLKHDEKIPKNQGENLMIGCYDNNSEMSAEDAVNRWYNEVCQPGYVFDNEVAESGTGHFSQVVWKATTKIGMAKQTRMHGNLKCTYIVARYSPAGNKHGEFKKNVNKGKFNEKVCQDVMRDLLKFQQRNEKIIGKQEHDLKQEQAVAKLQGKVMAMMQNKAMKMQKEKGKQTPQTLASSIGSMQDMPSLGQPGIEHQLSLPSQRGSLFTNASSQLPPSATSQLTGKYSSGNDKPKASAQNLKTMLSYNGSPTEDDDNVTLKPLGPTVKIVEQGDHGGIMFQRIENPKKVLKANKNGKFTAANVSGSLMQNGLAGRSSKGFEKSEKERPKMHRLIEKQTIHPDVDHVDIYGTVNKVSKSSTADKTHSNVPTKKSRTEEFEVPGETYRKTTTVHKKHLAKKPLFKDSGPQNTERLLSKEAKRPLKRPSQARNVHRIHESAVKIAVKPINGPSYSAPKLKTVKAVRGGNSNFAAKSFAVNSNKFSGKSSRVITSNKISSLPAKNIAPSRNNVRPIQRRVNSLQRVPDQAIKQTKSSSYVKSTQSRPGNTAASIKPRPLKAKLPSPFSEQKKLESTVVQSKQKATLVSEKSLQKPLGTPSHLNAGIVRPKPVSFATETKQRLTENERQHSSIKNTNSLIHNNLKPLQAKPIAPARSRPVLVTNNPGNFSTSKNIRPHNSVVSAVHFYPFTKTINAKSSSPVTNYRPVSAAMPLKPLTKPQSFSSPHPIKGPTAFDMKATQSSTSEPPPYYVTTMESPTPQSYNPATVSKSIGQLITGETQEDKLVFQRSALETHNKYRRLHRVPALRMNYGMSVLAEQYAKKIAQLGKLEHSGTEDGENIASVCRKDKSYMSGTEATNVWYSEICNPGYDFISGQPGNSGHFTQVVWKGTNQLGIGRAEAKRDGFICTFVVARYRPAGNFLGEFGKNVFRGAFDGSHCSIKKKDTIAFKHFVPKATTAAPIKRSRIPRVNETDFSKKNGIFDTEEEHGSRSLHDSGIDDSVKNKANVVWMPDLESGFRGSDIAGAVPLAVSVGTDDNLRKYADQLMNDGGDEDKKLAENFAAELLNDVKKEQNAMTSGEKVKDTGSVASNGNSKNMDIDAARIAFGNMVASIKKSTPTVRYINNSFDQTVHPMGQVNSLLKPVKTEGADSRSDANVDASLLLSQVNKAAQSLSKAASSIQEASKMQQEASNMQNNIVNPAQDDNQIALQSALLNEELAKMAANMKVAAASGPSNSGGSNTAGPSNSGPPAQSISGFAAAPNGGSPQPAVGAGGDLASSNMATANQVALSQAAKDKKIESKNYKPSELEQSGLNAHNRLRSVHDAAPLVLNQKLSQEAAAWAQKCADLGIARRSPSEDGENAIESCKPRGQEMTASEATEIWYSELCNPGYDFDAAEITGTERFTQVVWKATTEMGIGKVTKPKGDLLCTYIVARYHPPGNILGDVKQNVRRGILSSKHFCKHFLAASKFTARANSNLPSKIELMEQADSIGTTLEAGKKKSSVELFAGGDDPGIDGATVNKKEFRQEALYTHNRFRAIHLTPPLQMDVKLCQEAEQFAAYLASKGSLMRSKESKKGQNIAVSCNKDGVEMTGDEATNKWYNEVCNPGYDFKGSYPYGAAHFMQVIWASSKKFGIGKATTTLDDMLCTWVVGLYDPSGDMRNMQKENVLIGLFDYTYCDTFGKGGGGKGPSSGAIHNIADNKITAPAGSSATAKKKSELETRLHINHGPKDKNSDHEELFAPLFPRASNLRRASNHYSTHNNSKHRTRHLNRKKIRIKKYRKYAKKQRQNHYKLHHNHKRHYHKALKRIT